MFSNDAESQKSGVTSCLRFFRLLQSKSVKLMSWTQNWTRAGPPTGIWPGDLNTEIQNYQTYSILGL